MHPDILNNEQPNTESGLKDPGPSVVAGLFSRQTPTEKAESDARWLREMALSSAIQHSGKHVTTEHIVQKAQEFLAFLSGQPTPVVEDLQNQIAHLEFDLQRLRDTDNSPIYRAGFDHGTKDVFRALHRRRTALGLKLHDRVTVGQVLREIENVEEMFEAARSY